MSDQEAQAKAERAEEFQSSLNEILTAALRPVTFDQVAATVLAKVLAIPWLALDAKGCVFLVGETSGELVMRAEHGLGAPVRAACARVPFGHCLCGRAASTGEVVHASDLDGRHDTRYPGIAPHGHYCVPILLQGKVAGVLNLYVKSGHPRQADEERFLLAVAGVLAGAVERERLRASMVQADRLAGLGLLAAGVAHEINNPLTFTLYNLESLVEDLSSGASAGLEAPASRDDLLTRAKEALEGAQRIRVIARDLKTLSRRDQGERVLVNPVEVCETAIHMAYHEIKRRARLVKELAQVPPVLASEGRLAQVFLNLLLNAAQAIPEGRPELHEIRVRSWSADNLVWIEVRDSGQGIAPEHLERLFEPFFTTKKAGVGTGLGLSICQGIVTDLGGAIEVKSRPGQGTSFFVRLPAAQGKGPEVAQAEARAPVRAEIRGVVLIVDDEPAICTALERVLGRAHAILKATTVPQAQALVAEHPDLDAIVCDLMIPEVSGKEFHSWLLERCPELAERVIFVTGGAYTPWVQEFLDRVPNPRIEKPFDLRGLQALVWSLVRARGPRCVSPHRTRLNPTD